MFLLALLVSCTNKSKIESIFLAHKNEYWSHQDYCFNTAGNCFQFKEDGIYDIYLAFNDSVGFRLFNNDGDVINDSRTWSIKNDSTFVWDKGIFKIEKLSKSEILLSYYDDTFKGKKCYVRLSKWIKTPQGPKPLEKRDGIKE